LQELQLIKVGSNDYGMAARQDLSQPCQEKKGGLKVNGDFAAG
jgi:hypothetical protein